MYSRYMQNNGFFEPEYEQPFTYAYQRREYEERQREEAIKSEPPPVVQAQENAKRGDAKHGRESERKRSSERTRETRRERDRERKRESETRREREREERRDRERERGLRHEKKSFPLLGRLGGKGGLFANLDLDTGDILLILLLFYLYQESGDSEFLILLALLFLN